MQMPFRNRPGKAILPILLGCAVLALAAGVGVGVAMARRGHGAADAKKGHSKASHGEKKEVLMVYSLGEQVINLADTDMMRYVKITVAIGFSEKVPEEKLKECEPQLRDAVISVLTRKRFKELRGKGGLTRLKKEIRSASEDRAPEGSIADVYFEQFAMQ
jgi:flagellar FliL protein